MVSPLVIIDLRQIESLQQALFGAALGYRTEGQEAVRRAVNLGLARVYTRLKRGLTKWAGANRQTQIADKLRIRHARTVAEGATEGAVYIADQWTRITAADFNATWSRGSAGVRHEAWGRGQTAKGAFMIRGTAFKRIGDKGGKLKPLYGPNLAREVERHAGEVQQILDTVAPDVAAEAARQAGLAWDAAARRAGL